MRIFNQDKTQEINRDEIDFDKFKLVDDKLFIAHHEAVEFSEEKSRLETIAEYPNGGKDVRLVVDKPRVEAQEAYDEYEDILRIEPLNEKELLSIELGELETWFSEYDKQVNQYSRCIRLGLEYDKDIKALDEQAKTNAERISEIRKILNKEN